MKCISISSVIFSVQLDLCCKIEKNFYNHQNVILKDAYNFYSSKLFLHPYNSKVLQRLDGSEKVSRPGYGKNKVFCLQNLALSSCQFLNLCLTLKCLLGSLTCSCPPCLIRFSQCVKWMICRVLGLFRGSHLKLAGLEHLSKAVHC